jgi:hypothetical protein
MIARSNPACHAKTRRSGNSFSPPTAEPRRLSALFPDATAIKPFRGSVPSGGTQPASGACFQREELAEGPQIEMVVGNYGGGVAPVSQSNSPQQLELAGRADDNHITGF